MELKVWVEGIQRIVCGVTVNTTCQDVVFALAHATGKVGRFTLIERWRNNERLLAPNENPLKLLLKWGEYANDVQFILQRSEQNTQKQLQQQVHHQEQQHQRIEGGTDKTSQMNAAVLKKPLGISNTNTINSMNNNNYNNDSGVEDATQHKRQQQQQQQQQAQQSKNVELNITTVKELRKSLGGNDSKTIENVGIVKGIPQRQGTTKPSPEITGTTTKHFTSSTTQQQQCHSPQITNDIQIYSNNNDNNENININNISNNNIYAQIGPKSKTNTHEMNLNEARNSQDRRNVPENPEIMFTTPSTNNNNENLLDIFSGSYNNQHNSIDQQQVLYNNNVTPTISANGALVPPPYRDPPPPRNSPLQQYIKSSPNSDTNRSVDSQGSPVCQNCNGSMMHDMAAHGAGVCSNPFLNDYNDFDLDMQNASSGIAMSEEGSESIFQATQYNDLLALIKFQREKISLQQTELSKYDAEIVYLESKERDQAQELESISREITKADQIFRQGSEQLQTLQYVEEENELVKQQEKTLKSEIALLRSKLANCETELLQCKNKIRILMDDIEVEQRAVSNKQKTNRQSVERDFLIEMDRIQSEIDQAIHNTDTSNKTTENLKKEILLIENAIAEKKRQVEQLVNEMKEVNLQSLTVTTSDEIKHLLEGSNKPGSSRRIIGSPRQLENAVPTSKNPHGVWV